MELLLIIVLVVCVLNFLFTFTIATSIGKLVKYLGEDGEGVPLTRDANDELRGPDTIDPSVWRGGEPHSDGVARRSATHWDGVSSPE